MQDEPDDALMARAGRGDKAAFAVLVRRHLARATAVAQRILGNRSDAEEVVQEAFLRCWQKAPDWRPADAPAAGSPASPGNANDRAQFATWLYRVLTNLCLDRRRRVQPVELAAADDIADSRADGFAETARGEIGRRVAGAMAKLPDRQRAALALCYYEDLGNIEAAAALDITIGALESLLVRGRRALRESLGDLASDGGMG
jgi:RNA polymerase sigma-70 factor (ECF subfamily)